MTVEMIFFLKFLHVNGRFFDLRIVIGVQSGIAGFSQLFLCISSVVPGLSRSNPVLQRPFCVGRKSKSLRKTVNANFQKLKTLPLEAA